MSELIPESEIQQMRAEVLPLVQRARNFAVVDEATCVEADQIGAECVRRSSFAKGKLEPTREATHRAWKNVMDLIHELCDPYDEARKVLDQKTYRWRKEERDRREVEAAKAREAERKRIEDERLNQAEKLAQVGRPDIADKVLSETITVDSPPPAPVTKVDGTSFRENWQFRIVDESKLPREFLMPDAGRISKVVKAMKADTKIPGIEVWDEGSVARRKA